MTRPQCCRRISLLIALLAVLPALLAGCDVPRPPLEELTPVVGSATRTPLLDPNAPTVTPAPMTLPPTGRLWFLRGGQIWTSAPDGSGARAVTTSGATSPPVPSPDGRAVAWMSGRRLLLLDVAGGRESTVVEADLSPRQRTAWSPDGRLLAYFTQDAITYGDEDVWSVPAAGGTARRITVLHDAGYRAGPSFERSVAWTLDRRRVAVSGPYGPIQVIPLDVTAGNPVTVPGGELSWSTDNRNLLYAETLNGAIALYDVVTDTFQPYLNEKRRDGTRAGDSAQGPWPCFNADASLILYRAQGDDESPAVAVRARADGSEQLFLPGNNPAWAPDGQWIVYETGVFSTTATGPLWVPQGLARIRADGSGQAPVLADAQWPAWGR